MFKRINLIIILFSIFFFNSFSFAENKILFIDLDYVYSNSKAGKEINNRIKEKTKSINLELNKYRKIIDDNKKDLATKKNVLAKEEFEKKYIELEKLIKESNIKISKKNKDLIQFKNKAEIEFKKNLDTVLKTYAKDNSIQMIINKKNILIGKNDLDATRDILKLFDKTVKTIKLN